MCSRSTEIARLVLTTRSRGGAEENGEGKYRLILPPDIQGGVMPKAAPRAGMANPANGGAGGVVEDTF
jgi:hypothetical protein